jgi:sulfotransferase
MIETVHFISGLPRSGSTLLSALLKQNPRFHASVTSPVALLMTTLMNKMSGGNEFAVFFDDERRASVLRGLLNGYYADIPSGKVVFDTNRTWTARASLLGALYPDCRIICCVRDVGWIMDSLERQLRKNPLQFSRVFNFHGGISAYTRTETMMNLENGLLGIAMSGLREAWFSEEAKRLIVIDYDRLAGQPEAVLRRLYEALGERWFEHDFERVVYDEPDYDDMLGMPGMHRVREKVGWEQRELSIPPDLFSKYSSLSFWKNAETNPRGVLIL